MAWTGRRAPSRPASRAATASRSRFRRRAAPAWPAGQQQRQGQCLHQQDLEQAEPASHAEECIAGSERARPVLPGVAPVGVHGHVDQAVSFVEADRIAGPRGETRERDVLAQRVAQRLKPAELVQQVAADRGSTGRWPARRSARALLRPAVRSDRPGSPGAPDAAVLRWRPRAVARSPRSAVAGGGVRARATSERASAGDGRTSASSVSSHVRARTESTLAHVQAPDFAVPVVGCRASLDQPQSSVAAGVGAHQVTRTIGRAAVDDQDLANLRTLREQSIETRAPGGALH